MRWLQRPVLAIAAAMLWLTGGLVAGFALNPAAMQGRLRALSLRRAGARRVRAGSLAAWERDQCRRGEPCRCVALLHGLGDSALTWDSVLAGKNGAAPPPPGTLLLAPELPGSEGSDPPAAPSGYAIKEMTKTERDALASRCSTWTVVGNSLGGWMAAELALLWPEGVERLILVNPGGMADPTGVEEATVKLLAEPTGELMKGFAARAYHKPPPVPDRAWEQIAASIRRRPAKAVVAALRREDLMDKSAAKIRAPTTVVWGLSDRVVPKAVGEKFATVIPGARFVGVPDCGHLPQRECPAAVSREIFGRLGP